jgi:hypothetical protein
MGRLKEFAKDPKNEMKGYHWKVDADTYNLFKKYCSELNLSINEALTKLVELELSDYKPTRRKTTARAKQKRKTKKVDVADGDSLRVVDDRKKTDESTSKSSRRDDQI